LVPTLCSKRVSASSATAAFGIVSTPMLTVSGALDAVSMPDFCRGVSGTRSLGWARI
jgi:hypothetical protein